MRTMTGLLGFYQRSGLQKVARSIGVMNLFPDTLVTMERVLPQVPMVKEMKNRPEFLPSIAPLQKRVAFFTGCLMDTMFLETNN
ncbi:hypothetical protein, partial [Methylobacterium nigriterrae]|uniref:hypothetical protein n=1 Tax=Methylobacterium nigriterrae TaxID=3127512 RepID=UPI003013BAF3